MPRMKNSKKPSSPYKKVNTLTSFGFTSPKDKEKTAPSNPGKFSFDYFFIVIDYRIITLASHNLLGA